MNEAEFIYYTILSLCMYIILYIIVCIILYMMVYITYIYEICKCVDASFDESSYMQCKYFSGQQYQFYFMAIVYSMNIHFLL